MLFLVWTLSPQIIKFYPEKNPLLSISVVSPCGRADEDKAGLLEEVFTYQEVRWKDALFSSGARVEAEIGPDFSSFRVIVLKNFWETAIGVASSLVKDRNFESRSLVEARSLLALRLYRPSPQDFGIFLFYPLSHYAKPFPEPGDFNRISTSDLRAFKEKCFDPRRIKIVVEGSFLKHLIKKRMTLEKRPSFLPPLTEPPDRTPLKVGLLPSPRPFVMWFFKVIDAEDLCAIRYFLASLAMGPQGLMRSVFYPYGKVSWGIKKGRNVSIGWIKVSSLSDEEVFGIVSTGNRAIAGKLRIKMDKREFDRIRRQFMGKKAYTDSLPWPGFRREREAFLMEEKECSLQEVNSSLSDYPTRNISVLVGAREALLPRLVKKFASIGVFDSRGKLLYQVSK